MGRAEGIWTVDELWEGMMRRRAEAMARGPMTGIKPTWEWLVEQEPQLGLLLEHCKHHANPETAYDYWYGNGGLSGIKHRMYRIVGGGRLNPLGHPDLYSSDAYDLAYQTLLGALAGES